MRTLAFFFASFLALQPSFALAEPPSRWVGSASSAWGDEANWDGGMPNSPQSVVAMGDFSESPTMDLGGTSRTLRGLACQGPALAAFTVENGTLVLDINTDSEPEALSLGLGLVVKAVDLEIKADLQVANNIAEAELAIELRVEGAKLTISGAVTADTTTGLRAVGQEDIILVTGIISGESKVASTGGGTVRLEEQIITKGQFSTWGGLTQLACASGPVFPGPVGSVHIISGTLQLDADDQIDQVLVLSNGMFDLNGRSNRSSARLDMLGDATIQYDTGTAEELAFAASQDLRWEPGKKIAIAGFQAGEDKLRFGSDANGLSAAQLSQISFDGQPAQIDADGYVTPLSLTP